MDPYNYINSFIKFGKKGGYKPGLKRIDALLEAFDHPENKLNIIHVAGSNGKGSTIAYLRSIYKEAGYKVGVYTSPHLIEFNERIEIDGCNIKTEDLKELVKLLQPVVDKIKKTELGEPSYFEIVTTLAFLFFYQQQVDIVLLEVGLGGRLDATNVIKSPLLSIITSISLEHTSILGDTVQQIAREKAGIIKKGSPVITGVKDEVALEVIEEIAKERESQLIAPFKVYDYKLKESSLQGQRFSLIYKRGQYEVGMVEDGDKFKGDVIDKVVSEEEYQISLLGEYQILNAIVAVTAVNKLNHKYRIEKRVLEAGLKKAFIPGRMEIVQTEPLVLVDGAHNTDGIKKFVSYINDNIGKNYNDKRKIYLILAVLGDKDCLNMLKEIARLSNVELVISENNSERALAAELLKERANEINLKSKVIVPLGDAVRNIYNEAGSDDIITVVGSLYNIAQVKKSFDNKR